MRPIPFLAALILAAPASAQELGERTRSPEQMLAQLGLAPGEDGLAEAVAAAAAHPLGSRDNPVRVGGPIGARAYLARLRCANGAPPRVGEPAGAGVGAFGTIVDAYLLDCGAAAPGRAELVVDIYHAEHFEDRAPPGFTLAQR